MTLTRRDSIKAAFATLTNPTLNSSLAVGAGALLTACGGGGGSTDTPGAPAPPASQQSAPSALSYRAPSSFVVGAAIPGLTPTVTGAVTTYSVAPPLPTGMAIDAATGNITGTPAGPVPSTKYTVTASNSAGSTTYVLNFAVTATLSITAVSNAAPTALTPVTLSMTGLDTTQPFTITLAGANGYPLASTPIRTGCDGSYVVIGAPLYIDPTTGNTAAIQLTVTVTQGATTTNSETLAVADLPTVDSYGVQPGEISHAFLNQLAIGMAININGLQAVSAHPTSKAQVGTVIANLRRQQLAATEARDSVDLITTGSQPYLGVDIDLSALSATQPLNNENLIGSCNDDDATDPDEDDPDCD